MRTTFVLGWSLIWLGLLAGWTASAAEPGNHEEKTRLRVGTFDSRAVAIAYASSDIHRRAMAPMMEEHKKAKAAGDTKKAKELEAKGQAGQERLHFQGFGTAPVNDLLETVKDQLPAIAQKAGVDLIVSKWDVVYQAPGVEIVDVTDLIVEPFHPNEKAKGYIKELTKHPPVPPEVLAKHKDK